MVKRSHKKIAQQNHRASGWQAECEQINRDKARRIRRASWRKRVLTAVGVTGGAYAVIMGGWLWYSGHLTVIRQHGAVWFDKKLTQSGMVVQNVRIKGQNKLSLDAIIQQAAIAPNTPMFTLSLSELKERLQAHPQIAFAELERIYPNELSIVIRERTPAAIWQHDGQKHWVDEEGVVLESEWTRDELEKRLPVITGNHAPEHVGELMRILASESALEPKVLAAQWIGNRRWNVVMQGGVKVLLPMDKVGEAWQQLAQLQQQYTLLERAVEQIDLRIEGRAFVRYEEEEAERMINTVTASL